jgi:DNA-binding response OmpR family regulator
MQLLVVKDNGVTNELVEMSQRGTGFSAEDISVARTQAEGLRLIESVIPGIAIVDPHLTHDENLEDGIEFIRVLRARHRDCIVICLTMRGSNELSVRAFAAGAHDYIDFSWPRVNLWRLLIQKLIVWRGVAERNAGSSGD